MQILQGRIAVFWTILQGKLAASAGLDFWTGMQVWATVDRDSSRAVFGSKVWTKDAGFWTLVGNSMVDSGNSVFGSKVGLV